MHKVIIIYIHITHNNNEKSKVYTDVCPYYRCKYLSFMMDCLFYHILFYDSYSSYYIRSSLDCRLRWLRTVARLRNLNGTVKTYFDSQIWWIATWYAISLFHFILNFKFLSSNRTICLNGLAWRKFCLKNIWIHLKNSRHVKFQ